MPFEEDLSHEFKLAAAANSSLRFKADGDITKNLVAFLNARDGGTLYLGVRDDGKVEGLQLDRKARDRFNLQLGSALRTIVPPVLPDKVNSEFVPVVGGRPEEGECFVVEIHVHPGLSAEQPVPYENERHRAFQRLPGSTVLMTGPERAEMHLRFLAESRARRLA